MKHPFPLTLLVCSMAILNACGRPTSTPAGVQPTSTGVQPEPLRTGQGLNTPTARSAARIVGYYPSWGPGRGFPVASIPGEKLTHINYAFSNVSSGGECVLGDPAADVEHRFAAGESVSGEADPDQAGSMRGNFNQLRLLKEKYPHLQVLVSVGGWTWSGEFSDAALNQESREKFARSCIDLYLKEYAGVFDGIDIDWEYPTGGGLSPGRPEDKKNFTLMLGELRRQLDALGEANGRHYLLTIAAPAGAGPAQNMERAEIVKSLDWINLMTYDMHGTWESSTNFNAPLFRAAGDPADPTLNVHAAVQSYLNAGVPADQLVLGVPFYGKGWQGVPGANDGLYQAASGAAPGTWEPGSFDYKDLRQNYLPAGAYSRHWSTGARVPWLYSAETGIFISYDDPDSLSAKAGYAADRGLGGIMIWELSQDDGSLLEAIYARLQAGPEAAGSFTPTPEMEADADAGASSHIPGAPRPFEQEIKRVEGITIDGSLKDWPGEPTFTFDDDSQIVYSLAPGSWGGPKDFSARAWAGWSEDGLYFAFDVTDDKHVQIWSGPALWQGDYMELQIDTQLDKDYDVVEMNDDDYQLGFSPGDFAGVPPEAAVWFGPAGEAQVRQAQTRDGEGYVLEVFVPAGLLQGLTLGEGESFGMNLNPSDTDNPDQPQKLMMSTSPTRTLTDPTTFGKIVLVP